MPVIHTFHSKFVLAQVSRPKKHHTMQDCPLYPPNSQWMSENVISNVVVRHPVRRESGPIHTKMNYSPPRPYSTKQPHSQRTEQRASHPLSQASGPTPQNTSSQDSVVHTSPRCEPASENGQGDQSSSRELSSAETTLVLNRQRRRLVQQRYRNKWKNYADGLEITVVRLREEVGELEWTLQCMRPPKNMTESTVWNAVVEYFRLFRGGFKLSVPVSEFYRNCAALCVAHTQVQFFQAVMAPDVLSNAGHGLVTALEDWRQVSMHHEDLTIELVRMERRASNSVIAFMEGVTTITAGMLQNALGGGANWESVAAKLIGQQIVAPGTVYFQWDDITRRITSVRYVADMLTPLLKLLGNLEDVSRVLSTTLDIHYWSKTTNR